LGDCEKAPDIPGDEISPDDCFEGKDEQPAMAAGAKRETPIRFHNHWLEHFRPIFNPPWSLGLTGQALSHLNLARKIAGLARKRQA